MRARRSERRRLFLSRRSSVSDQMGPSVEMLGVEPATGCSPPPEPPLPEPPPPGPPRRRTDRSMHCGSNRDMTQGHNTRSVAWRSVAEGRNPVPVPPRCITITITWFTTCSSLRFTGGSRSFHGGSRGLLMVVGEGRASSLEAHRRRTGWLGWAWAAQRSAPRGEREAPWMAAPGSPLLSPESGRIAYLYAATGACHALQ